MRRRAGAGQRAGGRAGESGGRLREPLEGADGPHTRARGSLATSAVRFEKQSDGKEERGLRICVLAAPRRGRRSAPGLTSSFVHTTSPAMLRLALAAAASGARRRATLARCASSSAPPPPPPPLPPTSFIARAKAFGAQALLGRLTATPRFDRVLSSLRVTRVDEAAGEVDCEFEVEEGLQNTYSTLHGGATATLVDVVGSMALLSRDPTRAGVSVDLSVSYLAAARAGDTVRCLGRALKVGRRLGFSCVELRRKADGELLAVGRHTKAYTEERVPIPRTQGS